MPRVVCLRSDIPPALCRPSQSVRMLLNNLGDVSQNEHIADYIVEFSLDYSGRVFLRLEKDAPGKGILLVRDSSQQEVNIEIQQAQKLCLNDEIQSWTGVITVPGGSKCFSIACTRLEFHFTLICPAEWNHVQSLVSPP